MHTAASGVASAGTARTCTMWYFLRGKRTAEGTCYFCMHRCKHTTQCVHSLSVPGLQVYTARNATHVGAVSASTGSCWRHGNRNHKHQLGDWDALRECIVLTTEKDSSPWRGTAPRHGSRSHVRYTAGPAPLSRVLFLRRPCLPVMQLPNPYLYFPWGLLYGVLTTKDPIS